MVGHTYLSSTAEEAPWGRRERPGTRECAEARTLSQIMIYHDLQ